MCWCFYNLLLQFYFLLSCQLAKALDLLLQKWFCRSACLAFFGCYLGQLFPWKYYFLFRISVFKEWYFLQFLLGSDWEIFAFRLFFKECFVVCKMVHVELVCSGEFISRHCRLQLPFFSRCLLRLEHLFRMNTSARVKGFPLHWLLLLEFCDIKVGRHQVLDRTELVLLDSGLLQVFLQLSHRGSLLLNLIGKLLLFVFRCSEEHISIVDFVMAFRLWVCFEDDALWDAPLRNGRYWGWVTFGFH